MKIFPILSASLFVLAAPAWAEDPASTDGYKKAMENMHHHMAINYTGDADIDFAAGMIPHHQGAIDMAEVELQYGKDPELRKLAQDIIAAQKKEIAMMKEWLAKHGSASAAVTPSDTEHH